MTDRIQLWSCGGGRQSAGIAALIVQGRLPKPDHVAMVALEWEMRKVWPYVNKYIRAAMESLGVPFTAITRKKYATRDFFGGESGATPLIPAWTNQSGSPSKLNEWCSGEWKREVVLRWANEQPGWKKQGVDNWIGISFDEKGRRRGQRKKWINVVYPLLDWMPKSFTVSACLQAVEDIGWPPAPRSRCRHCPNQSDAEWAELTQEEFELACQTDEYVRSVDQNAFLHKQMIPLRQVILDPKDDNGGLFGGCSSGMCY